MSGWIISIVVIVVAVCAGLAHFGFRGRINTVGIDLGTTFSVVGLVKNGEVVIVQDKQGRRIFPSVVSYQQNGKIIVGYEAVQQLSKEPENTIYNAKRFIGRSLEEEQVKIYANEHPFKVVEHKSNYSKVGFEINVQGKESFIVTPEQVGTEVLKFLLSLTADFLGYNLVNKAVIAVPAKFDSNQRQATGEAYTKAGLKVMRVIEEPTAAAVAYKLHKKSNVHHILVYDFGGGTLDVSLLYVAKGSVEVFATDGDETLGGSDFDLCLFKHIKQTIEASTGTIISGHLSSKDHSNLLPSTNEDDYCIGPSIHTKAEEMKKSFSSQTNAEFSCIMPGTNQRFVHTFNKNIDFESHCQDLFDRSLLPVHRLLKELEMSKDSIDEIVLVGGSTRIPKIKDQLRDFFQKELNDHIDPDITVAYGAASILD